MEFLLWASLGLWWVSLLAGWVTIVLFVLWAVVTHVPRSTVLGVLPGAVGFNLANTVSMGVLFLSWDPVAFRYLTLAGMVILLASFLHLGRFLLILDGKPLENWRLFLSRAVAVLGWGVIGVCVLVFVFVESPEIRRRFILVEMAATLSIGFAGIAVSATLRPSAGDTIDVAELKRFFRRMVWPFLLFCPLIVADVLWPSGPHFLGYRYTSVAALCLVFSLFYLGFFLRWLRHHVERFPMPSEVDLSDSPLSEREKEVVALVLQGRSNKQIAVTLSLSSTTVRNHLSRIFPKLAVQSRFELMSRYKKPS